MAFNDILLHVDASKANAKRMEVTAALAAEHDAHLTGLYIYPRMNLPASFAADLPPQFIEMQAEILDKQAEETRVAFEAACSLPGVRSEWRTSRGMAADELSAQGRYSDIVVVGQTNEDDDDGDVPGVPDEVILAAGRPVLVVPYIGATRTPGQRVLVAWNASREAARAVNDALPLLERSEHVTVMVLDVHSGSVEHADAPGADICLHLARHGIDAEAQHVQARDIEVGELLLSRAADVSADLIVMGGYGHSRLRELMLGGVTRELLEHMTVPVLMSH